MRVRASFWNPPSIALVIAEEFCFSTPRIAMHRCVASIDDGDAERLDLLADGLGDLVRHALLDLEPPGEDLDQPRDLAEADHLALRDIGDVAAAEKRQQVMLAETVEVDVLDDHHLVIIHREQGVVEHGVDVGGIAARQVFQRLLDPSGRVDQSFA